LYLQEYFLEVFEEQLFIEGMEVIDDSLSQEILEELLNLTEFKQDEDSFSDFDLVFTNTFLGFKLANIERVVTINAIAAALKERGESFSLYTDDYDENLKNVDMRGQLDYRNHMPLVFRNSKINLNISLRNIRSGIPLRVWDILASRGFLLTNNQIELRDYFTDSKDIVIYRNIEDAVKKSLYYLDHDEERERIARNAYENVKNNHSYINRVEKILKIMELK